MAAARYRITTRKTAVAQGRSATPNSSSTKSTKTNAIASSQKSSRFRNAGTGRLNRVIRPARSPKPAIGQTPHQTRPSRKAETGSSGNQTSQVTSIPGLVANAFSG